MIRCWFLSSRYTASDTWIATSMRTPIVRRSAGRHEVSKAKAAVASWGAERMVPTIIAAPHRGQAHVAWVGAAVTCSAAASIATADVGDVASKARARVTRAARPVFARNPDWADQDLSLYALEDYSVPRHVMVKL
jgi:hypothetical protein